MRKDKFLTCLGALICMAGLSGTAQARSVCIDPGHGGSDSGAVGCGLKEAERTLYSAKCLKPKLEAAGYKVYMTRETDVYVGLSQRAAYANSKGVDTFVSIHNNAGGGTGIETYCYLNNLGKVSGKQAKAIQAGMVSVWNLPNRGTKEANFAVVRETNMPATLSELGFIDSCSNDVKYLNSASHQNSAMTEHCKAVCSVFGGTASKCSGGGSDPTPPSGSKGKVMAGTFQDVINQEHWLGGVKYSVGSQSQTSAASYKMMTFELPVGKFTATASKDGYETVTRSDCDPVTAGGTSWCSIALKKKAAVIVPGTASGDVKNASTKENIKGAKVTVKGGETAVYDGTNKWSFKLDPGTYNIAAEADGYNSQDINCKVEADKTADCTINLIPKKSVITGVVTDGTSNIAAAVHLGSDTVNYNGTDKFAFTVDAGSHTITAEAAGYKPGMTTCTAAVGQTVECNITLVRESAVVSRGILKGSVKDAATGNNIQADVETAGQISHYSGTADYRFILEPGTYQVAATAEGYEKGEKECTVKADESVQCDIRLTPHQGALTGRVLDAGTRKPIQNTTPTVIIDGISIDVESDGSWKSGSMAAKNYDVAAKADGYRQVVVSCRVEPGNSASACDLYLIANDAATGTLMGFVYDSRSENMKIAASVTIEGFASANYPGKGKWTMTDLPAGSYTVKASAEGYYDAVQICEVIAGDEEHSYSNCNIGLVAEKSGGDDIPQDNPDITLQKYTEDSCSGSPLRIPGRSTGLIAAAAALLMALGLRRRQSKGETR